MSIGRGSIRLTTILPVVREDVNEDHERTTSHMNSSWGDQLDHILSETEYEWHANLEPFDNMRSALECLVTEIALFHFRCEPPAEYMRVFHDFRAAAEVEDECGLLASVGGVAHEEIESEERKGKTAVFVAGWRSMEAHKDFKNTKTYREYMPKLLEGISGWRRTMCLFNACCREALDTPRIVDVSTQYILPICSLGRPSITLAILAWVFTAGESSATQRRT